MKTFVQFLKEDIDGEYWIDQHGVSAYADGDIGDISHEGHVINLLQSQISSKLGHQYDRGEYVNWDKFKDDLIKKTYEEMVEKAPNLKSQYDDEYQNDPDYFIKFGLDKLGVDEAEFQMADGRGDARDYAMEKWGWKRVVGNNIETWTLTTKDMRIIHNGINHILNDKEEDTEEEFSIYVHTTGQSHSMTLAQLEAGQIKTDRYSVNAKRQAQSANAQLQGADQQSMPSYYGQKKFPFADWSQNK